MPLTERKRAKGETLHQWLLSDAQRTDVDAFGLPGALVRTTPTWPYVITPTTFDARIPPRIENAIFSSLNTIIDSNWTSYVQPVEVNASMSTVWGEIIDFDKYTEWNPFHRQVKVVHDDQGNRSVLMWVNFSATTTRELIPIEMSSALSPEKIFYVDERPDFCILIYGLDWYSVPTLRAQIVESKGPHRCVIHSYDHFGSWLALFLLKYTTQAKFAHLFTLAANALKDRAEQKLPKSTL